MKRAFAILSSLGALLAATAGPAGAEGVGAEAATANPLCESSFSSLRTLAGASNAPAGRIREPRLTTSGARGELAKAAVGARQKGFKAKIPVYVHSITDGAAGQVTDAEIESQITVLNLAFAGFYGGPNTGFSFKLKRIERIDNAAWFAGNPETPADLEMKQTLQRGNPDELNLYLTSGGFYLGWAYFPDVVVDEQYSFLDGVVIDYRTLPGGPYGSAYSLGQTATHEVGHWLALWHTFDNSENCMGIGDEVADTPFMSEPTGGCPEGKDSCPALAGLDPIHNYMDYSFDSCYEEFTVGQTERMQAQFLHWRDKAKYPRT